VAAATVVEAEVAGFMAAEVVVVSTAAKVGDILAEAVENHVVLMAAGDLMAEEATPAVVDRKLAAA
jgi:hypothetical protein